LKLINASVAKALVENSTKKNNSLSRISRLIATAIQQKRHSIHIKGSISSEMKDALEEESYNVNSTLDEFDKPYVTISWR
jgi:predicted DNA-binding protein (UPF0278 family)